MQRCVRLGQRGYEPADFGSEGWGFESLQAVLKYFEPATQLGIRYAATR
jgi:hypothetical protein